jgi:hypothetical protein
MHFKTRNENLINFLFWKEYAILVDIYYHSRENVQYLHRLVDSSGIARVKDCQPLGSLNGGHGVDVILLEYQENNPALDRWITQTTSQPDYPAIFLFAQDLSPNFIWKALKLGARELFTGMIPPDAFQEAVLRVDVRKASLAGQL